MLLPGNTVVFVKEMGFRYGQAALAHLLLGTRDNDVLVIRGVRRLLFQVLGVGRRFACLGLRRDRWHSGGEEPDDFQGSPDERSSTSAEGLHLLNNVFWLTSEGSLLSSYVSSVVPFPVLKVTLLLGLLARPVRWGLNNMGPLVEW